MQASIVIIGGAVMGASCAYWLTRLSPGLDVLVVERDPSFATASTALSAAGIDLTALGVLGGALGVGIGFGLQKLAANYVSGFVILAERSMRIGDNVRVDGFEGRISDIKARYTVIRSATGRESIVPNEMLITQRVENMSLTDPKVWQSTVVTVAYSSPVDEVMAVLVQAPRTGLKTFEDTLEASRGL